MVHEPDLSLVDLCCSGYGGQVQDKPPRNYFKRGVKLMFSHLDGTALCMYKHGVPAEPVEHQKRGA